VRWNAFVSSSVVSIFPEILVEHGVGHEVLNKVFNVPVV